MNTNINHYL